MYSQSCPLLQNKNQSPLSGPIGHNLGLFATRSYTSSTKTFMDIKPNPVPKSQFLQSIQGKTNMKLVDFVYSLNNSTRIRPGPTLDSDMKNIKSMKSRNYCRPKEVLEPSMPITSLYLVGGFVGSKSQLGCRSSQSFDLNMWDLIGNLGLVDVLKSNRTFNIKNSGNQQNSSDDLKLNTLVKDAKILGCTKNNFWPFKSNVPCDEKRDLVSKKQSYAEVAKSNLPIASCKDSQIDLPVIATCTRSDEKDMTNKGKLPYTPCTAMIISAILQSEAQPSPNEGNSEDGNTNINSDSSRGYTCEDESNSPLAACEESLTNSSTSENVKHINSVTSCEMSTRPRPLPTREVKINERKVSTEDDRLLSLASLSGTMKSGKLDFEKLTCSKPIIKGILKTCKSISSIPETSYLQDRNRLVSQCSDDSEDSFVVFEQSEDDTSDNSDDDGDSDDDCDDSSCCESDEDSILAVEVSLNILFIYTFLK